MLVRFKDPENGQVAREIISSRLDQDLPDNKYALECFHFRVIHSPVNDFYKS